MLGAEERRARRCTARLVEDSGRGCMHIPMSQPLIYIRDGLLPFTRPVGYRRANIGSTDNVVDQTNRNRPGHGLVADLAIGGDHHPRYCVMPILRGRPASRMLILAQAVAEVPRCVALGPMPGQPAGVGTCVSLHSTVEQQIDGGGVESCDTTWRRILLRHGCHCRNRDIGRELHLILEQSYLGVVGSVYLYTFWKSVDGSVLTGRYG